MGMVAGGWPGAGGAIDLDRVGAGRLEGREVHLHPSVLMQDWSVEMGVLVELVQALDHLLPILLDSGSKTGEGSRLRGALKRGQDLIELAGLVVKAAEASETAEALSDDDAKRFFVLIGDGSGPDLNGDVLQSVDTVCGELFQARWKHHITET